MLGLTNSLDEFCRRSINYLEMNQSVKRNTFAFQVKIDIKLFEEMGAARPGLITTQRTCFTPTEMMELERRVQKSFLEMMGDNTGKSAIPRSILMQSQVTSRNSPDDDLIDRLMLQEDLLNWKIENTFRDMISQSDFQSINAYYIASAHKVRVHMFYKIHFFMMNTWPCDGVILQDYIHRTPQNPFPMPVTPSSLSASSSEMSTPSLEESLDLFDDGLDRADKRLSSLTACAKKTPPDKEDNFLGLSDEAVKDLVEMVANLPDDNAEDFETELEVLDGKVGHVLKNAKTIDSSLSDYQIGNISFPLDMRAMFDKTLSQQSTPLKKTRV